MAGKYSSLFTQTFTSVSTINITHNLNKAPIGLVVRVVIGDVARPDLINQTYADPTDPYNKMVVLLESTQSGFVQILDADIIRFATGADFVNTFNFQQAESLAESSTTSTTYIQKLRLTTTSLPAGEYLVMWNWEYSQQSTTDSVNSRIQVDDTTTLGEYSGAPNITYAQGGYYPGGGFAFVTLGAGIHTIDVDYSSSSTNKTAYIRRVRLSLWRVS